MLIWPRILLDPADGTGGGKTGMDAAQKTTVTQKTSELEKQDEVSSDIYERMVGNIEKSKEELRILREKTKIMQEHSALQSKIFEVQESRFNQLGAETMKLATQIDKEMTLEQLNQKKLDASIEFQAMLDDILKNQDENLGISKEEVEVLEKKIKLLQKEFEQGTDKNKAQTDTIKLLREINEENEKAKAKQGEAVNLQRNMDGVVGNITDKMGLQAKLGDTQIGKFVEMGSQVKAMGGGMGTFSKMMGSSLLQSFNLYAIIAQVVEKIIQMGLELDAASKKLGGETGFGDVFSGQLLRIQKAGNMAGIGVQEASKALSALSDNLSSFNPTAERTNAELGLTVARLEKLGVSAGASTKLMDHFQRTMGMTAKQAADTTAQLAVMGKEIGVTGVKMVNDFTAASGRLAMFGKNNIKVFKDLAAQAKATGLEMSTLISISEKFDRFDTAADSAAQLNAVLGTQLSTLELMNANDADRVMMIRQQVGASVSNLDSLDKFTQQYIAQAMGVKDVADAQRLLNMSVAEYQKYQQGQKEQADIQAKMADATERLVPIMDQLKLVFNEMVLALSPLIIGFISILQFLNPMIRRYSKMISIYYKFIAAVMLLSPPLMGIARLFKKVGINADFMMGFFVEVEKALDGIIDTLMDLYGVFHLAGSPMLYEMFDFIAGAVGRMASAFINPIAAVSSLTEGFKGMFGALHSNEASKSFDISAMAKLDTTKIAGGLDKIKSSVMELSNIKMDGFLALSTDGASTSMMMGSDNVIKNLSEGKLTVDVKMSEFKMPEINVKVYIGDRELRDIIRTEVSSVVGGAG